MTRRLLQRQIMPLDRDLEVMSLYVDLEDARLDEDKYIVGGTDATLAPGASAGVPGWTTSRGSGWTPSGCRPSTGRR